MRYLDVCAGISASTVAWKPLGWEAAAYSEIEAAPRAVLAHHYPNVPLHGDFTTIKGDEYGPIDLLVGGTPCQDFSVAGLRAGLDGDRGNLSLEFLRLADRARPRWVVWENVPGVLSIDRGRAFGAILGGLGELGYGFAYRVLDAQFFGVPQRRRRVFVVGRAGDWRGAAAVLSERHSLSGHPAPRREAGKAVAALTSAGVGTCGADDNQGQAGHLIAAAVADTLPAGGNNTGGNRYPGTSAETAASYLVVTTGDTAHCLNAGGMGRQDYETETMVIMERGRGGEPNLEWRADGTANAILTPNCGRGGLGVGAVCIPDVAHALRGEGFDASEDGTGRGTPLVPCIAPTLTSNGDAHSGYRDDRGLVPVAFDMRGREGGAQFEGPHDTANIRAASGGSSRSYVAASAVRRLTPRECERLQGFPDDYTAVPHRGKPMADGPRYKALGNSMAVPVMRWIGERIAAVDALHTPNSEVR